MVRNCAISSMTMKLLDIWVRRNALPVYKKDKVDKVPSDWIISLLLVTEMRYESFTPNHIKLPESRKTYTEPWDFAIHIGIFSVLQALPIQHPTLLALKVLLSIYISGTAMHLLFRYKSSPALFGPIYLANSLAGFWSETWHNVYASACVSLTYLPIRNSLRHFGVSKLLSHAIGIIGVFSLMAIFHVYVMHPVLGTTTLIRVGLFFFLNGIATIAEAMIWGREKHWMKSLLAWAFEITLATWTANSMAMPVIPLNCSSGATIY
ncbi:hypothetical protein K3495_g11859 [Podosphaera aphanis]|nr:hypothetical protein K3495_g11859 [Podosphaera aphanis]